MASPEEETLAAEEEPLAATPPAAFLDAEEGGGLPADWWLTGWAGVKALPAFPRPEHCDLCCQRVLGKFVVGMLISMFAGITYIITLNPSIAHSDLARFCRFVIFSEAIIAISCLFTLQYLGRIFYVKRTPETCFPLPAELVSAMRRVTADEQPATITAALYSAAAGLGNVADPSGVRGVFCVRCFVWREEEGHHCSECQRCTNDFDHHCGVLGSCIGGRGLPFAGGGGNMWLFVTLISMAAAGMATMIGTAIITNQSWSAHVTMAQILLFLGWYGGGLALIGYVGFRGFMWVFYDRHAHRRVNKRRSA